MCEYALIILNMIVELGHFNKDFVSKTPEKEALQGSILNEKFNVDTKALKCLLQNILLFINVTLPFITTVVYIYFKKNKDLSEKC